MPQALGDVQICSLGNSLLGGKPFQSLNDNTPAAILCNLMYPLLRDQLLKSFRWKFAIKRATLNPLANVSVVQFQQVRLELPNGKYIYGLPNDYLNIIETDQDPSPYKIESLVLNSSTNTQTVVLLSDNQEMSIRYVSRIVDPTMFDPTFTFALAWLVAQEIALPVTGDLKKWEMAQKMYGAKIAEARFQGSIEDSQDTLLATYLTTDVR